MVDARRLEDWNHTATTLAMQANTAFGKKGKALTPDKFHPYLPEKPKKKLTREQLISELNAMVGLKEKHGSRRKRT